MIIIFLLQALKVTCDGHRAAANSEVLVNFVLARDVLNVNTWCAKTSHLHKRIMYFTTKLLSFSCFTFSSLNMQIMLSMLIGI